MHYFTVRWNICQKQIFSIYKRGNNRRRVVRAIIFVLQIHRRLSSLSNKNAGEINWLRFSSARTQGQNLTGFHEKLISRQLFSPLSFRFYPLLSHPPLSLSALQLIQTSSSLDRKLEIYESSPLLLVWATMSCETNDKNDNAYETRITG